MFDNVECGHHIKRVVFIWQLFGGTKLDRVQTTLAAELNRLLRYVNAFSTPEPRQHLEIRTRTTPNVENPGVRRRTNFLNERPYDSPPSDIPPVSLLNLIKDRIMMLLHLL